MWEEVWRGRLGGCAIGACHAPEAQWRSWCSAVIFDFYGTLAHFADTTVSNYETVFAAHGYQPERAVLDSYFARYDGVDHAEHSVSEEAYEAWVRASPA